jgi:hypothetical protein
VQRKRLDPWLERFGLSAWRDRKVEELSKGMAQKIQLIASVLPEPAWLFLDEPFSGLDPVSTDALREVILDLPKGGTTILFSTHKMEIAERLSSGSPTGSATFHGVARNDARYELGSAFYSGYVCAVCDLLLTDPSTPSEEPEVGYTGGAYTVYAPFVERLTRSRRAASGKGDRMYKSLGAGHIGVRWLWITRSLPEGNETVFAGNYCITCHSNANEKHPYADQNPRHEFRDYVFFAPGLLEPTGSLAYPREVAAATLCARVCGLPSRAATSILGVRM